MPVCPQCGSEYATEAPTRSGYCRACEEKLELPVEHAEAPAAHRVSLADHAAAMPVTVAIIAINVIVYLLMVARHVSPTSPNIAQLQRWGADYGPLAFSGQWWRVITNVFVHIGIFHLLVNMWALWSLGALAERLYGRWLYLYIYLFCGVAGSIASLAWHPTVTGAGASGAIFGLAGALIVTFRWGNLPIPSSIIRPILSTLIVFTVANVLFGLWTQFVDNAAHLGGLTSGLLVGAMVIQPALRGANAAKTRVIGCASLALLLAGTWGYVERANFWAVHLDRSETALRQNKVDEAINEMKQVVASKPNDARFQLLLAEDYLLARQVAPAHARLLRAAELDPKDPEVWSRLGGLYGVQNQPQQAYEAFLKRAALQPNLAEAQYDVGIAAVAADHAKEGIAAFKRAIELRPNFADAYQKLARTYLLSKDTDGAIATLQQMAKAMPQSAEPQAELAQIYVEKGDRAQALAALKRGLQINPKAPQLWWGVGVINLQQRKYDDAIAAFQELVKLVPKSSQAEFGLAAAYQGKGMNAEAAAAQKKAEELRAAEQQLIAQQQAERGKQQATSSKQ